MTPYGYKIENGTAVIVEEQAEIIKKFFENYLSGMGLAAAAKKAGIQITHSMAKKMIRCRYYIGDNFYPAIIAERTFHLANAELKNRAVKMNRLGKTRRKKPVIHKNFIMNTPAEHYENPAEQAEYIYSLIESNEVK